MTQKDHVLATEKKLIESQKSTLMSSSLDKDKMIDRKEREAAQKDRTIAEREQEILSRGDEVMGHQTREKETKKKLSDMAKHGNSLQQQMIASLAGTGLKKSDLDFMFKEYNNAMKKG